MEFLISKKIEENIEKCLSWSKNKLNSKLSTFSLQIVIKASLSLRVYLTIIVGRMVARLVVSTFFLDPFAGCSKGMIDF